MSLGAMGAGAANALEDLLKQKFLEQIQRQKLAEEVRQANMQHGVQQRQLGQGDRRIDHDTAQLTETQRQFNELAPQRSAGVAHTEAQTGEIKRRPQAEEAARTFTAGESQKGRDFQGGQGDLNRGNAVRIANIHGTNALRVANVRHPDTSAAGPTQREVNEVEDSIALIKQIREDKALPGSTGPIQGRGFGALGDLEGFTRVKALHDNLVNKMQLAQAGKLKGQGAISNMEREMLKNAATALDMKLGDADYLNELAKVEQQFGRMLGTSAAGPRATAAPAAAPQAGGAQEYDYVPGKGLVPRKQ